MSEIKKCEELGLCPQLGSEWVRVCESFARSRDLAIQERDAALARVRVLETAIANAHRLLADRAGHSMPGQRTRLADEARDILAAVTQEAAGGCPKCLHSRHLDHDCPRCTCSMNSLEAAPASAPPAPHACSWGADCPHGHDDAPRPGEQEAHGS